MSEENISRHIGLYINLPTIEIDELKKSMSESSAENKIDVLIKIGDEEKQMTFAEFKKCIFD